MTHMVDSDGVRTWLGGVIVQRAAALHPDQTSADIFSIAGGRIILLGLVGHVSVAVPANHDYSLFFDPDNGDGNVTLASTLAVDSDPAGTYYRLNTVNAGALVAETNILYDGLAMMTVLDAGDIVWTVGGGGTVGTTTRVAWDLFYAPLDAAATVVTS